MIRIILLILLSVHLALSSDARTQPEAIVRYEQPAPLKDRPSLLIRRLGYITSYNKDHRTPNWVAWHLTKAHTYGKAQRKGEQFAEDEAVAAPRATPADYYNSRYDRGHMCPAGDNKWDQKAMTQTFLLTNICPQNHGLNKYEWNDVEMLCRDWARKYEAVDVVCGPIYYKDVTPRYIGKNRVRVPDAFFKVVLCRKGQPKAIGFIFPNGTQKTKVSDAVCTVDEVERQTGIDFFPALDDKTERQIEAQATLKAW